MTDFPLPVLPVLGSDTTQLPVSDRRDYRDTGSRVVPVPIGTLVIRYGPRHFRNSFRPVIMAGSGTPTRT